MGTQLSRKRLTLLRRIVHHQHTVDARRSGIAHKAAFPVLLVVSFDGVGIAHEHDGCGGVAFPEFLHHRDDLDQPDPQGERAVTGFLDHRSVGGRIGKRNAELDDVGSPFHHAVHEVGCDVGKGETRGDEGDQGLAVLRFERVQCGFDAAHLLTFTTMVSPLPLTDWPLQLGRQ